MNNRHFDEEPINKILARLNATSAGPWVASIEGRDHTGGSSCLITSEGVIDFSGASDADIEFIANARQDIIYLVDELHRLTQLLHPQ